MDVDLNSRYVTLLNKFCRENDFFPPVFKLMSKWGVGGAVRVRVSASSCSREAAAATEMEAREIAAERIYKYLLQRSPQAAEVLSPQELPRSAQQSTGVTDYHGSLIKQFEEHKRISAVEALNSTPNAEMQIARAAAVLGLELMWEEMPPRLSVTIVTLNLPNPMPPLVFLGDSRDNAASQLANHLKQELLEKKDVPLMG